MLRKEEDGEDDEEEDYEGEDGKEEDGEGEDDESQEEDVGAGGSSSHCKFVSHSWNKDSHYTRNPAVTTVVCIVMIGKERPGSGFLKFHLEILHFPARDHLNHLGHLLNARASPLLLNRVEK